MDKYDHIAVPAEDGDYVTTGTVADYEDWLELPDGSTVGAPALPVLTTAGDLEHALAVADKIAAALFPPRTDRRAVR